MATSDVRVRLKACDPAQPSPTRPWKARPSCWALVGSRLGCRLRKAQALAFSPMISVGIEWHLISCDPLLKQLISDHSFLLDSHVHVASVFCPARLSISISSYNICLSMLFYHGYPVSEPVFPQMLNYDVLWPPENDILEVKVHHKWPSTPRRVEIWLKAISGTSYQSNFIALVADKLYSSYMILNTGEINKI